MTIQTRTIEYTHGDTLLEGFLAWDDALDAPRPGVAVAHAWAGRGEFEQDKAIKLAELGYVGFALDMYGKGVLGSGPEENTVLKTPFMENRQLLQERMDLEIAVLRDQEEVDAGAVEAMG